MLVEAAGKWEVAGVENGLRLVELLLELGEKVLMMLSRALAILWAREIETGKAIAASDTSAKSGHGFSIRGSGWNRLIKGDGGSSIGVVGSSIGVIGDSGGGINGGIVVRGRHERNDRLR
jgi:hypothetical protein